MLGYGLVLANGLGIEDVLGYGFGYVLVSGLGLGLGDGDGLGDSLGYVNGFV